MTHFKVGDLVRWKTSNSADAEGLWGLVMSRIDEKRVRVFWTWRVFSVRKTALWTENEANLRHWEENDPL
jgi:hypothetical protein